MLFRDHPGSAHPAGFTLIELLCVMAIVAIVSGFLIATGSSTNERARPARAVAELTVLRSALEAYKTTHGDYPRTATAAVLLQSLIGKFGPTSMAIDGRSVLELAHFTTFGQLDPFATNSAELVDPWGRAYVYAYKSSAPWTQIGYVLFSNGPDGTHAELLAGGRIDEAAAENHDNIYAR